MKLNRPKFVNYEPGQFPTTSVFDVVELKYDGWWGQLVIEGDRWKLFSRTGQRKQKGTLSRQYGKSIIHGEYCYGTQWAKNQPQVYNKIAVHHAEIIDGQPMTEVSHHTVRKILGRFLKELEGEEIVNGLFLIDQWPIAEVEDVWAMYPDFEGLVFKNADAPWGAGYGRMKRDASMDYICMGFEKSEAERNKGWGVAAIIGGLYENGELVQKCKMGGMNDADRRDMYLRGARYVGRVFEANGKKVMKSGALRHPNFVRWRNDKPAEECRWPI